jgi:LPXTG-motif cell wall-anchored protein
LRKLMLLAAMVALALVAATPAVAQVGQGFGQENVESGKVEPQVGISSSPDPAALPEAQAPAPQVPAPQAPAPAQAKVNPEAKAEPGKAEAKAGKAEAKAAALPKTGGIAGVTSLLGLGAGVLLVAGGLIARRIVR